MISLKKGNAGVVMYLTSLEAPLGGGGGGVWVSRIPFTFS